MISHTEAVLDRAEAIQQQKAHEAELRMSDLNERTEDALKRKQHLLQGRVASLQGAPSIFSD